MSETPQTDRLLALKIQWEEFSSRLPNLFRDPEGNEIPRSSLTDWFTLCIAGLQYAETHPIDPALKSVTWPSIAGQINVVMDYMQQGVGNGPDWFSGNNRPHLMLVAL